MDPASAIGAVSGAIALIQVLVQGIYTVRDTYKGAKNVSEERQGLDEELEALRFALSIIEQDIDKGNLNKRIEGLCKAEDIATILRHAIKTVHRLEAVLQHIDCSRAVPLSSDLSKYYRSSRYEKEISHLRERIRLYTSSLNMPAIWSTNLDGSRHDSVLSRLVDLENHIQDLTLGIKALIEVPSPRLGSGSDPQMEGAINSVSEDTFMELRYESEELVRMTYNIVSNASTVVRPGDAANNTRLARRDLHRAAEDRSAEQMSGSISVQGIPLRAQERDRIDKWISGSSQLQSVDSASAPETTASNLARRSMASSSDGMRTYTALTAVESDDDEDIEIEIARKRLRKVIDLIERKQYTEAIPHARRTLSGWKILENHEVVGTSDRRQQAELYLAKALMSQDNSGEEDLAEAVQILRSLIDVSQSIQNCVVLELLAQTLLKQKCADLEEAKKCCVRAIRGYRKEFGRFDQRTQECIALMVSICSETGDTDVTVWQELFSKSHLPTERPSFLSEYNSHEKNHPLLVDSVKADSNTTLTEKKGLKLGHTPRIEFELPSDRQIDRVQLLGSHGLLIYISCPRSKAYEAKVSALSLSREANTFESIAIPGVKSKAIGIFMPDQYQSLFGGSLSLWVEVWVPRGSSTLLVAHGMGPNQKPFKQPRLYRYTIEAYEITDNGFKFLWDHQKIYHDKFYLELGLTMIQSESLTIFEDHITDMSRSFVTRLDAKKGTVIAAIEIRVPKDFYRPMIAPDSKLDRLHLFLRDRTLGVKNLEELTYWSLKVPAHIVPPRKATSILNVDEQPVSVLSLDCWMMCFGEKGTKHLRIVRLKQGENVEPPSQLLSVPRNRLSLQVSGFRALSAMNKNVAVLIYGVDVDQAWSTGKGFELSRDGALLCYYAIFPSRAWLWDLKSGALILETRPEDMGFKGIFKFDFDADNRLIACTWWNDSSGNISIGVCDVLDEIERFKTFRA